MLSLFQKILLCLTALAGLHGCGDSGARSPFKKNSNKKTVEPVTTDTDTTTDTNEISQVSIDPTDEGTQAVVLENTTKPSLQQLKFTATSTTEDNRRLSEYLLVITANKKSCIKFQAKPNPDLEEEIDEKDLEETQADLDCTAQEATANTTAAAQTEGEADCTGDKATTPECVALAKAKLDEAGAGLALTDQDPVLIEEQRQNHNLDEGLNQIQFALTTPALCSEKIFRMPATDPSLLGVGLGLSNTVRKSAFLVSATDHVKVWLDHEVGNPCLSSSTPASLSTVKMTLASMNPLAYPDGFLNTKDRITTAHFTNIAQEAEKIYESLTDNYGDVSDVDGNQSVDIFITPEVNRLYFSDWYTSRNDLFRAMPAYKPEDLSPFNATKNPTSNESEAIYMWAPDPAGIYRYSLYPTANSITSNYQKGYIGSQIMSLIMLNAHKIQRQDKKPEERWLVDSLSLLASAYAGGNDYTVDFLAEYLAYRHHYLSLTDDMKTDALPEGWRYNAYEAQLGFRAMFGWYLHSRVCGITVEICAGLKELVDTERVGIKNIEALLDEKFDDTLKNFGQSVGVYFADDPEAVRALLTETESENPLVEMPQLQELNSSTPPQTVEQNETVTTQTLGDDRAVAGPFPSLKHISYQTLYPDEELNLTLSQNSVTYVLLTGLVEDETEMLLYLGSNVTASIVSLGERVTADRRIHFEKISELAHMDQAPVNLTQSSDSLRTYYASPVHSVDYTVTPTREVMIYGSLDNFKILDSKKETATVGDTDTFNIKVDVCSGVSNESQCRAGASKRVLVQLIPREGEKELDGMMAVTSNSLELFRGKMALGDLETVKTLSTYESKFLETKENRLLLCLSEASYQTTADYTKFKYCGNGGVLKSTWDSEVCSSSSGTFFEHGACKTGFPQHSITYDGYSYQLGGYQGPAFDNFFHSALGYPFLNNGKFNYPSMVDEGGWISRPWSRDFLEEEKDRQFFSWKYSPNLKPYHYIFNPIWMSSEPDNGNGDGMNLSPDHVNWDAEKTADLVTVWNSFETGSSATSSDAFLAACQSIGIDQALCEDPIASYSFFEASAQEILGQVRIYCSMSDSSFQSINDIESLCGALKATSSSVIGGGNGTTMHAWLNDDQVIMGLEQYSNPISYISYYPILLPKTGSSQDYCSGLKPSSTSNLPVAASPCTIIENVGEFPDIRSQFNVPFAQIKSKCESLTFMDDFQVCLDPLNFAENAVDAGLKPKPLSVFAKTSFSTDRSRSFALPIAKRGGEIIGKHHQLPYISFKVKPDKGYIINLMIGGLAQSQGKYLARVRVVDYTPVLIDP